jgi:hypothetical protein
MRHGFRSAMFMLYFLIALLTAQVALLAATVSRIVLSTASFAHGGFGPAQPGCDPRVRFALGGPQHQLGASYHGVWESSGTSEATQLNTLLIGEVKGRLGAAGDHNQQLKPKRLVMLVIYGTLY